METRAEKFQSHVIGMIRSGHVMTGLARQYPQIPFVISNDLRRSIKRAKQVIDQLAELKPISRWGINPDRFSAGGRKRWRVHIPERGGPHFGFWAHFEEPEG